MKKPTPKQLAYLKSLAAKTGTTFAYPATSRQASAEIKRLQGLPASGSGERVRELRGVQRDLAERPGDNTAIRASERARLWLKRPLGAPPDRQPGAVMTAAGKTVELKRYRIPSGERALQAQRIDGRVAVIDVPVDHDDRVYLVERHVANQAELHGLAAEYAQRSETCGVPAILATLRTADELVEAIA